MMRRRLLPSLSTRRGRLAGDAGFALPTVLFMMLGAFAIASAAAVASIGAQQGTTRDHDVKGAIAAAEAGVSQALLRYNRVRAPGTTSPCLVVSGGTMEPYDPGEGEWCVATEGQMTDGSRFTYWVLPMENEIEIVSQGVADAVARRVEVRAISKPLPVNPFADATLIGLNSLDLASGAKVEADVATNNQIGSSSGSTLDCETAQVGEEHAGDPFDPADGTVTCAPTGGTFLLPPVNQGDVVTNNSNGRLFVFDPIHGKKDHRVCWNGFDGAGNATDKCGERELVLEQNVAVTLGGSNYSFCKLTMLQNTTLYIAAGATVNIFFDSPEGCGYTEPETRTQMLMHQNSSIKPNGGDAMNASLLFVGSEDLETRIELLSNTHPNSVCGQSFVIYAPLTDIVMSQNARFCGAMAGKSIDMLSNAHVIASNHAQEFTLPNEDQWSPYWRDRFVECSGFIDPAGSPSTLPNDGC